MHFRFCALDKHRFLASPRREDGRSLASHLKDISAAVYNSVSAFWRRDSQPISYTALRAAHLSSVFIDRYCQIVLQ